ncbi:MAG: hypothetical protein RMA76_01855 [Deltaproteobacteria bacterium]|jgi:hypothetical protein
MALTTLVLLSALSGHPASAVPRPKTVQMRGEVREVSGGKLGKSRAVLVADDGEEYTMHGIDSETGEELTRLAGVKIDAFGLLNDPRLPRGRHVLVQRYQIVDVGKGVVPRTGVIASVDMGGTKRLLFVDDDGRADLLPEGWGKKMNRHVGARIWMVGSGEGASFKPLRFSILRGARK